MGGSAPNTAVPQPACAFRCGGRSRALGHALSLYAGATRPAFSGRPRRAGITNHVRQLWPPGPSPPSRLMRCGPSDARPGHRPPGPHRAGKWAIPLMARQNRITAECPAFPPCPPKASQHKNVKLNRGPAGLPPSRNSRSYRHAPAQGPQLGPARLFPAGSASAWHPCQPAEA